MFYILFAGPPSPRFGYLPFWIHPLFLLSFIDFGDPFMFILCAKRFFLNVYFQLTISTVIFNYLSIFLNFSDCFCSYFIHSMLSQISGDIN